MRSRDSLADAPIAFFVDRPAAEAFRPAGAAEARALLERRVLDRLDVDVRRPDEG